MMKRTWIVSLMMTAGLLHAGTIEYTVYAKVKKSIPEYERIIEREPYEECWTEHVQVTYYEEGVSGYRQGGDPTAAGIIGGVTGGVLGHQIGKGRGKDVATVAGAVIGTLVGQNMAREGYRQPVRQAHTRYESRRHCTTRYREHAVREVRRYKNIAWYRGRKIVKYSDRPLKRIPLYVTVSY